MIATNKTRDIEAIWSGQPTLEGTEGALTDIVMSPTYLDVSMPPGTSFTIPVDGKHTVGAYVFEGQGYLSPHRDRLAPIASG